MTAAKYFFKRAAPFHPTTRPNQSQQKSMNWNTGIFPKQ
jgi:hypothetical protein